MDSIDRERVFSVLFLVVVLGLAFVAMDLSLTMR